jgi:hypothetical protein
MVSWVAAGGVAAGGILVGSLTIAGYVSPGLQLLAAPVLFLVGSFLGAVHGAILAIAGRPETLTRGAAARRAFLGGVASVPVVGAAWVVTAGISLTAALVREWHFAWAVLSLGGWFFGLALCAWATVEGWRALRRAYARWPEGRLCTALTVAILAVSCVLMVRAHPSVWGTDLRLNDLGAVALALAVTLWIGFPLVWTILHVAYGWHAPHKIQNARGVIHGA